MMIILLLTNYIYQREHSERIIQVLSFAAQNTRLTLSAAAPEVIIRISALPCSSRVLNTLHSTSLISQTWQEQIWYTLC